MAELKWKWASVRRVCVSCVSSLIKSAQLTLPFLCESYRSAAATKIGKPIKNTNTPDRRGLYAMQKRSSVSGVLLQICVLLLVHSQRITSNR